MVDTPRVVDRESANDSHYAQQITEANWVYLGGGYAHVALPILQDTKVMEAIVSTKVRGRGFVTLHRTRQDFERYSAGDKLVL